jgi:hypothetical protein
MTTKNDRRHEGGQFTVGTYQFDAQTFPATLTTARSDTAGNVNGTIVAIKVVTTDTEDGITYTVAITDANSATLFSEAAMADNSQHWRDARSDTNPRDADFNPIPVASTLTCTITPSAAPDAVEVGAKTATVTVTIYVE